MHSQCALLWRLHCCGRHGDTQQSMQHYVIVESMRTAWAMVTIWNRGKVCRCEINTNSFFKPLCLVFVDSNRTMSSSIGAIWSFISDFIFAQTRNHKQHPPNSTQLHHQPGNWCVCTFHSDRVHRFVLTETDNSLASLSATAVGLLTLMGNSWLDITKIFISNLFAVLDGTVEWTTESAVSETVAVTNNGSEAC